MGDVPLGGDGLGGGGFRLGDGGRRRAAAFGLI